MYLGTYSFKTYLTHHILSYIGPPCRAAKKNYIQFLVEIVLSILKLYLIYIYELNMSEFFWPSMWFLLHLEVEACLRASLDPLLIVLESVLLEASFLWHALLVFVAFSLIALHEVTSWRQTLYFCCSLWVAKFSVPSLACSIWCILSEPLSGIRLSIVVSIRDCHSRDRGSIPRAGETFCRINGPLFGKAIQGLKRLRSAVRTLDTRVCTFCLFFVNYLCGSEWLFFHRMLDPLSTAFGKMKWMAQIPVCLNLHKTYTNISVCICLKCRKNSSTSSRKLIFLLVFFHLCSKVEIRISFVGLNFAIYTIFEVKKLLYCMLPTDALGKTSFHQAVRNCCHL